MLHSSITWIAAGLLQMWKEYIVLRAFGSSLLGLPVVVARAHLLVAVSARRNTQTLGATLQAEEHAWLLVRCRRATIGTLWFAICMHIYIYICHIHHITKFLNMKMEPAHINHALVHNYEQKNIVHTNYVPEGRSFPLLEACSKN